MDHGVPEIPSSWLYDSVDMDEIERDWLDQSAPYGVPGKEWARLKSLMKNGDEILAFSSASESWQPIAGRAGYAVVREGRQSLA